MTPQDWIREAREVCEKATPVSAQIYEGEDAIHLSWHNPYENKEERIASFWWPTHPVDKTGEVEKTFEATAKLFERTSTLLPKALDALSLVLKDIDYPGNGIFDRELVARISAILSPEGKVSG